ncbi:MAG: di-trans,poly-cis-decaprenylcistransferase [Chloroflexi bacterium]|nr:di-trans,poly-cis-decaprenylcistransferase [Chloroflexota bacterium]|tara:strand:- start:50 stop:736 length:687 start_codon:yes stop_codon:yes gene_type:complete
MDKINSQNIQHVAIIMDGNGRWAEKKELHRSQGHKKGLDNILPIVEEFINQKIQYVTLFAFSTENNKRPYEEKKNLINLLDAALNNINEKINENNINLSFIGDLSSLPKNITSKIQKISQKNKCKSSLKLIIAWNYSGRSDILNAIREIEKKYITEKEFESYLMTKNIPDPDLIIRTGNQMRISNFMLWQSAYSELYFSKKLWPEFTKKDLNNAIVEFKKRKRNYGNV